MKQEGSLDDRDKFIEDLKAKQNNLTWPGTLIGGRSVDAFLWRGSPNPTLVQRLAAWLLGTFFFVPGLLFVSKAKGEGSWLGVIVGWGFALVGAKVFRNGFPRRGA